MEERIFIYVTDVYGNPGSYAIAESEIENEWASLAEVFNWDELPEAERPSLSLQYTHETIEDEDGNTVDIWYDQYVDNDGEVVYVEFVQALYEDGSYGNISDYSGLLNLN